MTRIALVLAVLNATKSTKRCAVWPRWLARYCVLSRARILRIRTLPASLPRPQPSHPARRAFVLLAALAAALVLAGEALACSCLVGDPRDMLERSAGAFSGTLVERVVEGEEALHTFSVDHAVKGSLGSTVQVKSHRDGATCGLEIALGQRVGLFLDREGETWTSTLCQQIDPDELLAAAAPLPAPTGSGPVAVLVGGSFGDVRTVALDDRGRVLAYGAGDGDVLALSVCPGSERRGRDRRPSVRGGRRLRGRGARPRDDGGHRPPGPAAGLRGQLSGDHPLPRPLRCGGGGVRARSRRRLPPRSGVAPHGRSLRRRLARERVVGVVRLAARLPLQGCEGDACGRRFTGDRPGDAAREAAALRRAALAEPGRALPRRRRLQLAGERRRAVPRRRRRPEDRPRSHGPTGRART